MRETDGVLLELTDLSLQLSIAVEITQTETNHNDVAINLNLNVVGQEEADLISYQKQKQIEAKPQQFDLLEHVKSTKHYNLVETARCLNINMEHLHWKVTAQRSRTPSEQQLLMMSLVSRFQPCMG